MAICNAPIFLTRIRPLDRLSVRASELPQRRIPRPDPFPSLPQQLSDPSPNPFIDQLRPHFIFRVFEIHVPPSKLLVKRLFHRREALPSVSAKYFSQRVLEPLL